MGSCASTHKPPPMKLVAFGSKAGSMVIPESPKNENSVPGIAGVILSNLDCRFPLLRRVSVFSRSKEETFFDSQAWVESDCDEDFHSVRGDFTPSRGNTPKHSFSEGFPCVNNSPFEERFLPGLINNSLPMQRKKLVELFRDSIREETCDDPSGNQSEASKKSAHSTPYVSGASSSACSRELSAIGDSQPETERPERTVQCCLPAFVSCGSLSERKKKMSPAIAVE